MSKISASNIARLLPGRQVYDLKLLRSAPSQGKTKHASLRSRGNHPFWRAEVCPDLVLE